MECEVCGGNVRRTERATACGHVVRLCDECKAACPAALRVCVRCEDAGR